MIFAVLSGLVNATPALAVTTDSTAVGATSLTKPSGAGRYIYVSPSGNDRNDDPTAESPLKTIKAAVQAARPGDVIVVRAGTYSEAVGFGAVNASATRPIVLQAMPNEKVVVAGTLMLKEVSYWTVYGLRFVYNPAIQTGQSIVSFRGGTGWSFRNNEVRGSVGVANLLVTTSPLSTTTTAARVAAAPKNYTIAGNCIHSNDGSGTHGQFHNIYLMTSIYSSGGVVERNLLGGAPEGANIKLAGPSSNTSDQSPNDVIVRYNTMVRSASGVTIGLDARGIVLERNLIAIGVNSDQYDGGVKTYQLKQPLTSVARDTMISGYTRVIEEDGGVATPFPTTRITTDSTTFSGSLTSCDLRNTNPEHSASFGRDARDRTGSFMDDNGNTHEANIEAIRAAGITYGCGPDAYCPSDVVTRAQMAAFLNRALNLPAPRRDYFRDDTGMTFESNINSLREAGITFGCNPPTNDRFCPNESVTRAQMAGFLVRAFSYEPVSTDYFTDDEGITLEGAINSLAAEGVTYGCNPPANTSFCPSQPVKRDQMASFFARALGLPPIAP